MTRITRIAALGLLLSGAAHAPALASGWSFKLFAATSYVAPLAQTDQNLGGVTAAIKASNEMGYAFGTELRAGYFGLGLDYLHARQDLEQNNAGLLGTTDFNPISATLYLHVPTPLVELYAGPTLTYVNWGDLTLGTGGAQQMDAKFGSGISVGGDFAIAKALALTAGMRWLKLEAKPKGGNAIAVDPLVSHIGLALRF